MPIRGLSKQLQKAEDLPKQYTIGYSDLSGGVGTRWGKEERTDLRSLLGYWYGTLDTWNPGQATLPLLSVASTTPTRAASGTSSAATATTMTAGDTGTSTGIGNTTLTDTGKSWTTDEWVGTQVVSQAKTLLITSNTATVLTGSGTWDPNNPASSQTYIISELWPTDTWVGWVVTSGGETLTVTSNTSTILTGSGGWSSTPAAGAYTMAADITSSKTDYASLIECYTGGAWRVLMVKGDTVWNTTSTNFASGDKTVPSAQGRQLLAFGNQAAGASVFWLAGASAWTQVSTDGSTWADSGSAGYRVKALCGWVRQHSNTLTNLVYSIGEHEGSGANYLNRLSGSDWAAQLNVYPLTGTGFIPLGVLTDSSLAYVANGPEIWEFGETTAGLDRVTAMLPSGVADVTAACRHEDQFAITDGSRITLWHPSRPPQDVSIWGDDGCPDDMVGEVKALQSLGPYLIAYWEFENASPVPTAWRGDTIIFWSRPNLQGQTTWHPRSGILTGGFPLSIGSPMVMAEHTVTNARLLWNCTADTTTGRTYYQIHPFFGLNPNATSGGVTLPREDSYHYLYTRWEDLILVGNEAGAVTEAAVNAKFPTSSELISLDYRGDYENYAEQDSSAGWEADLKFKDTRPHIEIGAGRGTQADAFQFKVGMDRGSTTTNTPSLFDLAVTVERQTRHPSKRRS